MKAKKPCLQCIVRPTCKSKVCPDFVDYIWRLSAAYLKNRESSYLWKTATNELNEGELERIKSAVEYYSVVNVKYSLRPVGRYVLNRVYAITVT